jgi:hypothetical protein
LQYRSGQSREFFLKPYLRYDHGRSFGCFGPVHQGVSGERSANSDEAGHEVPDFRGLAEW